MATTFSIGQRVQHFTNPQTIAVVRAVQEPKDCGAYGVGNWLRGTFAPGAALVTVEYPATGLVATTYAQEWEPARLCGPGVTAVAQELDIKTSGDA